ncbi:hypothetical protein MRB53_017703 [Persea americana]|uniref:Uncharacterized protein n=1 Tax=Persea americana TaxID=3435 RepID=A0ACC2M6S3_PERAE|nr:hypothetical protein MRB53_017703 [Persea americana]
MEAGEIQRKKREECKQTKHDHLFSKWKVLIGPSDWENYSLGKDGVERYRLHNLPISCSCPGLYELGIAKDDSHNDEGHKIREFHPNCVIVVYLGQAENVRTRLQHYGRVGSHLDHGNSFENTSPCLQRRPGLFREVFSRGFPIVFRWVPMQNKKEAEKTEAQLLRYFDYAWNKGGNGARRQDDVLLKLDKIASGTLRSDLLAKLPHLHWRLFGGKHEGVRINASMPSKETETASDLKHNLAWRPFKFSRNQPHVVSVRGVGYEDHGLCGVSLGDGSVCRNRPIEGRKRCGEHKGKRINGSISTYVISREGITKEGKAGPCAHGKGIVNEDYNICGVPFSDGSVCTSRPIEGRKRCGEHKGKRINGPISTYVTSREGITKEGKAGPCAQGKGIVNEDYNICGVPFSDGSVCTSRPIEGRKRCGEHKGKRINWPISTYVTSREGITEEGSARRKGHVNEDYNICGVPLRDGSVCRSRPIEGRKRCGEHKGQRKTR